MLSNEIQLGRFGRTCSEIREECNSYNSKEEYTLFLVRKAQNHMKVSELFECWETLNVLEYVNSSKFETDMKEYVPKIYNHVI